MKLYQAIQKEGKMIGRGYSREAYLYNGKVFKFDYNDWGYPGGPTRQTEREIRIANIISNYTDMILPLTEHQDEDFPLPIVSMPLVSMAHEEEGFSDELYNLHGDIDITETLSDYIDFLKSKGKIILNKNVEIQVKFFEAFFPDSTRMCNYGYQDGFVRVVDLGHGGNWLMNRLEIIKEKQGDFIVNALDLYEEEFWNFAHHNQNTKG